MKVLLGDISSYKAIAVAKFLRKAYPRIKIVSFDTRGFTNRFRTKYSDDHIIFDSLEIPVIAEVIKQHEIDFFIPVINESLAKFWENKYLFHGTMDYLGDFEQYTILNDKKALQDLAQHLAILMPREYQTIEDAIPPFVVKPTNLSSAKGVQYVRHKQDLNKILEKENMIIQQYVQGKGIGYSFYCLNGTILNGYGHERLAEYPVSGGSSTYRKSYEDERIVSIATKIVSKLKYTGFAMFEFKLTSQNEIYLLEVNPRIWGSVNQGLVNGNNYFESLFGVSETLKCSKKNYYSYISPLVYLSMAKYLLKLEFDPIIKFIGNIFINKSDVNLLTDFGGYSSIILRKLLGENKD